MVDTPMSLFPVVGGNNWKQLVATTGSCVKVLLRRSISSGPPLCLWDDAVLLEHVLLQPATFTVG